MRFRGLRGCATWRWAGMQRDRDVPASEVVRQRIPDIARRQTSDAADTIPACARSATPAIPVTHKRNELVR